jgi:Zn-dependent M28 family amino/carboxypeptidase
MSASRPPPRRASPAWHVVVAACLLPVAAAAAGPPLAPDADAAAAAITTGGLLAPVRFLASDLLEGRAPGSRGDELARAYLAAELEGLGFRPGAADGSYQQRFRMLGIQTDAPATWSFRADGRAVDLARWDDYIAETGLQSETSAVEDADLVFVGYGIQAPEYDWDDYEGADLRGKVLLMLNDDPDWDPALFAGRARLYYGRWDYKYESAARQGAAGAIIVHTTPSAGYPWQVVQTSWSAEKFELPARPGEPRLRVRAWATDAAVRRLLAASGHDLDQLVTAARSRDFRPVDLGIRTSIRLAARLEPVETANVLGLLPGSDPELASQVVVYSAHHDHLGIGTPDASGDRIYNGAVDNATGCAQLLGVARAFAALPRSPRRSILIAFVAAEEQGLLGSAWFAAHPTFAAGRIAADVNLDAGNVFGRTRDVTFIGYGRSTLDGVIERAAARQGRRVVGDPLPDRGFFYRSDQFSFARIGVPGLYLEGGQDFVGRDPEFGRSLRNRFESTCYHQPCDEVSPDWDLSGLVEDTRLAFECGLEIAQAAEMPGWRPGDEFAAARARALAAVGP